MVFESLLYRNGRVYDLDTFTMMPNHLHLLFAPLRSDGGEFHSLSEIMMSLKAWTAGQANSILGRKGVFWPHESYDHIVRDEREWQNIGRYGLAERSDKVPGSWWKGVVQRTALARWVTGGAMRYRIEGDL